MAWTRAGKFRERYRRAVRSGYAWLSPRRWLRRFLFWGGAIAVGLAATVFSIFGFYADAAFREVISRHGWLSLAILPAGVASIAFVTRRLFPGTQGSGIPQTIVAQAPLTAFVIVMKMTANHDMVFPLMTTVLLARGASRLICKEPLYKGLAEGFVRRSRARGTEGPSGEVRKV